MPRLIDADALIQILCVNMDTGQQFNRATHCVDEMPTVDAIPIEWLMDKCEEHKLDGYGWVYTAVIEDWRLEHGILETTRNYSKRGNGDPNGFNDETVQALKDTTERKNLSKVYETMDDMYADMVVEELHDLIRAIGTITYGKERWFDENDGTWYDRKECDSVPLSKIIDRVIDAVREAEEY